MIWAGQRAIVQIVLRNEQEIDVARQLEMLKPVVQDMDRRAKAALQHAQKQLEGKRTSGAFSFSEVPVS